MTPEELELWNTLRNELRFNGDFAACLSLWDYAGTYKIRVTYLSQVLGVDYGTTLKKRLMFALDLIRNDPHYLKRLT